MDAQPKGSIPSKGPNTSASSAPGSKKGSVSSTPSRKKNSVSTPRRKNDSFEQPKGSIPSKGPNTSASSAPGSKKGSVSSTPARKKSSVSTPRRKDDSVEQPKGSIPSKAPNTSASSTPVSKKGSVSSTPARKKSSVSTPRRKDDSVEQPKGSIPSKAPNTSASSTPVSKKGSVSSTPSRKKNSVSTPSRKKDSLAPPGTQRKLSSKAGSRKLSPYQEHAEKGSPDALPTTDVETSGTRPSVGPSPYSDRSGPPVKEEGKVSASPSLNVASQDQAKDKGPPPLSLPSKPPPPPPDDAGYNIPIEVILVLVVVVVAVVVVLVLPLLKGFVRGGSTSASSTVTIPSASSVGTPSAVFCESEACRRAAKQLRRGLSRSSQPCEDFYLYVCGNWVGPAYEEHELFQKFVDDVGAVSRAQLPPSSQQTATEMAAMAYQTCEDIVRGNRTSMTTVKLVLHEAGFFSLGTWNTSLKILNASFFLEVKWRIASPFKIRFVQKTGPGLAIHLGPSQSVEEYLDRRQQSDWGIRSYYDFDEMKGTFQSDIEEKIPYAVWQRADDKVTNDWLRKLPTGEKKMKPQSWDESDMYEKVTIMSRDDWATLLNTYFGNPMPLTFRVLSPDLFSSFAGLPNLVGHDMARPYYRWYMVEVLAGAVYAPWITRRHPDYNSALQHQRRKCFAILETSAGYAFLAPYVRNTFSTEVTDDIVSLLRQVRGAYGKLFARTGNFSKMANLLPSYSTDSGHVLDFLDDATLEERYYHYEAMTTDPLDNWRRLKTGLESSVHGDVTMDAPGDVINHLRFYIPLNPHQDFILRPDVAVLPYFDPRMPPVLKLAGLGSIMAYAMTDAIYAAKYNWTDGERKTWDSSISCIRHWVSSVSDSPEGQLDLLKRTLALATVVLAQQKLAVESESGAIVLKDLPELSGTQLLFVAWCHLECGKKHGLRRCNVPVEDLPSFAEAFKCKEGARMRAFELCTQDLLGT